MALTTACGLCAAFTFYMFYTICTVCCALFVCIVLLVCVRAAFYGVINNNNRIDSPVCIIVGN